MYALGIGHIGFHRNRVRRRSTSYLCERTMPEDEITPELYRIPAIAAKYSLTNSCIYKMLADGRLEGVKLGERGVLITRESVERWRASLPAVKPSIARVARWTSAKP
jgi:excisionase family DNA binding protein